RVLRDERALNGIEPAAGRGQPFDRADLPAARVEGQHQARIDGAAVDDHRAPPARSPLADLLRARQIEPVPERRKERRPRLDRDLSASRRFAAVRNARKASLLDLRWGTWRGCTRCPEPSRARPASDRPRSGARAGGGPPSAPTPPGQESAAAPLPLSQRIAVP